MLHRLTVLHENVNIEGKAWMDGGEGMRVGECEK